MKTAKNEAKKMATANKEPAAPNWHSTDFADGVIAQVKQKLKKMGSDYRLIPLFKAHNICAFRLNVYSQSTGIFCTKHIADNFFVKVSSSGDLISLE